VTAPSRKRSVNAGCQPRRRARRWRIDPGSSKRRYGDTTTPVRNWVQERKRECVSSSCSA
jgi:hypothetical protein